MRTILLIFLAIAIALVLMGCGKETPQTNATEVTNPPDSAPKVADKTPPPTPEPPQAPPAAAPTVAPKPGKDGWVTLANGLKYKDKKVGTGAAAALGQSITVHYKGWLDDGKVFDSSRSHGPDPVTFNLVEGGLIKGWTDGIPGMKVGGVRELIIPAKLGYGDMEQAKIPAGSTLHFTVELIKVGE